MAEGKLVSLPCFSFLLIVFIYLFIYLYCALIAFITVLYGFKNNILFLILILVNDLVWNGIEG